MVRTKEVLFASVTRDTIKILGLFDHSVFYWSVDNKFVPERERLRSVYDDCRAAEVTPGTVFPDGYGGLGISTAGTPTIIALIAMCQMSLIRKIEPKLSDLKFVEKLFVEHTLPKKLRLEWHYNHLDFGLLNVSSGHYLYLTYGPN